MSDVHHPVVTPYVGVWIETFRSAITQHGIESHPTWVCGLKHCDIVTVTKVHSHTLRGCVD